MELNFVAYNQTFNQSMHSTRSENRGTDGCKFIFDLQQYEGGDWLTGEIFWQEYRCNVISIPI